jgi:hypothetical protein
LGGLEDRSEAESDRHNSSSSRVRGDSSRSDSCVASFVSISEGVKNSVGARDIVKASEWELLGSGNKDEVSGRSAAAGGGGEHSARVRREQITSTQLGSRVVRVGLAVAPRSLGVTHRDRVPRGGG